MEFAVWEPVYEAILADFGYDRAGDERARDMLAGLVASREGEVATPDVLDASGKTVAVAGAGPSLEEEINVATAADVVFAASTAARTLRAADVSVDCMVTDLDKVPETAIRLARFGTPIAVHAHGDNAMTVREVVPELPLSSVLPTTQAEPAELVGNYGGFTDGDRAAFLADYCGADRLVFPGWDFDDTSVPQSKQRKLQWAERLLYWLEKRRNERFEVLDGRREAVDTAALPVE